MKKFIFWVIITMLLFTAVELYSEYIISRSVNDIVLVLTSVVLLICTGAWVWYTLNQIFKLLKV